MVISRFTFFYSILIPFGIVLAPFLFLLIPYWPLINSFSTFLIIFGNFYFLNFCCLHFVLGSCLSFNLLIPVCIFVINYVTDVCKMCYSVYILSDENVTRKSAGRR